MSVLCVTGPEHTNRLLKHVVLPHITNEVVNFNSP